MNNSLKIRKLSWKYAIYRMHGLNNVNDNKTNQGNLFKLIYIF